MSEKYRLWIQVEKRVTPANSDDLVVWLTDEVVWTSVSDPFILATFSDELQATIALAQTLQASASAEQVKEAWDTALDLLCKTGDPSRYRIYHGWSSSVAGGQVVTVNGEPLPGCQHIINHSPDGFGWGYGGSGPAQLALAMLYDHFRAFGHPAERARSYALQYHQSFKAKVIANLPDVWWLTTGDLETYAVSFPVVEPGNWLDLEGVEHVNDIL